MAKKKKQSFNVQEARTSIVTLLDKFAELADAGDIRPKVLALVPAFHTLREIGTHIIPDSAELSARDRILLYFQKHPLTILDSDELMVVSGISDYPRRIRELRVEFGWPIFSGETIKAMLAAEEWDNTLLNVSKIKPKEYVILDKEQDRDAAYRWKVSNAIRREKLSVQDKIIKYLRMNVGKAVTGEELVYVANGKKEWARRVRELRTQEGWPIRTRNTGMDDLPIGVYVLEEDKQAEPHDRNIEDSVRVAVLIRDHFSCRKCGWKTTDKQKGDPRQFLELHHLNYHANKGSNEETNLITLCNVHHDEVHKKRMDKATLLNWADITDL